MDTFNVKQSGQAMVEYLLILGFVVLLSIKMISSFSDFLGESMGTIGHILTVNLTTGVCKENCFFAGYQNGFGE